MDGKYVYHYTTASALKEILAERLIFLNPYDVDCLEELTMFSINQLQKEKLEVYSLDIVREHTPYEFPDEDGVIIVMDKRYVLPTAIANKCYEECTGYHLDNNRLLVYSTTPSFERLMVENEDENKILARKFIKDGKGRLALQISTRCRSPHICCVDHSIAIKEIRCKNRKTKERIEKLLRDQNLENDIVVREICDG